jgi:hypothetical protein
MDDELSIYGDEPDADLGLVSPIIADLTMSGSQPSGAGDQDSESTNDLHGFPKVARVRANLTTLSQHYNLYFTAYQDKVYVYQPQKAPQILPPVSLILQPPRTKAAKAIGGTLDKQQGHMMNHITVGDLGNMEILLLAFDDGDVVAYYTHLIAHAVGIGKGGVSQSAGATRATPMRPFFHDNVGLSAWGLAIHKQSELFAVGSNKHEVTVFAFATRDKEKKSETRDEFSPKVWSGQTALELERHFRSRTRTWRIVLPLGVEGHNVPSIAFCDDERGNADKVVAVDVRGNTWILDIWKIGGFPALLQPSMTRGADNASYMGWGVVVLPDSSFRPAHDNKAAMGLPATQILGTNHSIGDGIRNDIWLDITCSLYNVQDNAADTKSILRARHGKKYDLKSQQPQQQSLQPPQSLQSLQQQPLEERPAHPSPQFFLDEFSDVSSAIGTPSSTSPSPTPMPLPVTVSTEDMKRRWAPLNKDKPPKGARIDIEAEQGKYGFLPARTIVPTFGQTLAITNLTKFQNFLAQSPHRKARSHAVPMSSVRFPRQVATNYSILRTTCTSVELQSLDPGSASVLCRDVIPQHNYHHRRPTPWDLSIHLCERISMLQQVPELGLVVLGSLNGRVALLSLSKPPERHGFGAGGFGDGLSIPRAFRVEAVLPRKSDEDKKLRPWVALHGIAVSPAPELRTRGLGLYRERSRGQVWRLILHYMDHTILMYDITRRLDADELLIF